MPTFEQKTEIQLNKTINENFFKVESFSVLMRFRFTVVLGVCKITFAQHNSLLLFSKNKDCAVMTQIRYKVEMLITTIYHRRNN